MDAEEAAESIRNDIENFIISHTIVTSISKRIHFAEPFIPVSFQLDHINYTVFVLDEYDDLNCNNEVLRLILVLRELEALQDASDYLDWCKQQGIDASNEVFRTYYMETIGLLGEIRTHFPQERITTFITDLDFQLNNGAIQYIRKAT